MFVRGQRIAKWHVSTITHSSVDSILCLNCQLKLSTRAAYSNDYFAPILCLFMIYGPIECIIKLDV